MLAASVLLPTVPAGCLPLPAVLAPGCLLLLVAVLLGLAGQVVVLPPPARPALAPGRLPVASLTAASTLLVVVVALLTVFGAVQAVMAVLPAVMATLPGLALRLLVPGASAVLVRGFVVLSLLAVLPTLAAVGLAVVLASLAPGVARHSAALVGLHELSFLRRSVVLLVPCARSVAVSVVVHGC